MPTVRIDINMDKQCKRCGKPGATQNGYCLECITKMMMDGELDHIIHRVKKSKYRELQRRADKGSNEEGRIAATGMAHHATIDGAI